MVQYRRILLPGGTYFFTVALRDRRKRWLVDHIELLRASFTLALRKRPFSIDAMVVLPEHLHAVWTLPPGDSDYSGRWKLIKSHFSHALSTQGERLNKNARGEYGIWQRRYWEHMIRDGTDLARHVEYIHYNPVKHGYVASPIEWPHSSFGRDVEAGKYPADWAAEAVDFQGIGHE